MTGGPSPDDVISPLVQYTASLTVALARMTTLPDPQDQREAAEAALAAIDSAMRLLQDTRTRLLFSQRASRDRDYRDVVDRIGGKP